MKMEYWIQNADHSIFEDCSQGTAQRGGKRLQKEIQLFILLVALMNKLLYQRENTGENLVGFQALPENICLIFHHYDDCQGISGCMEQEQDMIYEDFEPGLSVGEGRNGLKVANWLCSPQGLTELAIMAAENNTNEVSKIAMMGFSPKKQTTVNSAGSKISPASVPAGRSDSAARKHTSMSFSAVQPNQAGCPKRPAPVFLLLKTQFPFCWDDVITAVKPQQFTLGGKKDQVWGWGSKSNGGLITHMVSQLMIHKAGSSRIALGLSSVLMAFLYICRVKGGIVKFGGGDGRKIRKGTIRTPKLDFKMSTSWKTAAH
ncbi:hypothetical protein Tco_1449742 [Tanacetum coccineum]